MLTLVVQSKAGAPTIGFMVHMGVGFAGSEVGVWDGAQAVRLQVSKTVFLPGRMEVVYSEGNASPLPPRHPGTPLPIQAAHLMFISSCRKAWAPGS